MHAATICTATRDHIGAAPGRLIGVSPEPLPLDRVP